MQQNILRAIIETEENERKRVSQELHDGLGPVLSTIKLFAETYLNSSNEAYKKKISAQLLTSINEALEQVSIISNNLSPQILIDFGLSVAVTKFIDKLNKISSLSISFQCNLKNEISNEKEITIYRIVTELIANSVKHAYAKNVDIIINQADKFIYIEYKDDGIGFDYSKTIENKTGMGLFNIQHRIKSFNGEIEFTRNKSRGIKFIIKLPL
jgi:signal transduction histidine kinase